MEQPYSRQDAAASGMLALHTRPGLSAADRFAWLTEAGPYCGRLMHERSATGRTAAAGGASGAAADVAELGYLGEHHLIRLPAEAAARTAAPLSMVRPTPRTAAAADAYRARHERNAWSSTAHL